MIGAGVNVCSDHLEREHECLQRIDSNRISDSPSLRPVDFVATGPCGTGGLGFVDADVDDVLSVGDQREQAIRKTSHSFSGSDPARDRGALMESRSGRVRETPVARSSGPHRR